MSSALFEENCGSCAGTGYWGPPQTNVRWCEIDYEHSHYIAEFHNTWSNFVYVWAGLAILYQGRGYLVIQNIGLAICIVGIGSTLFHLTQTAWAQALDEVPMMLVVVALFNGFNGLHDWLSRTGANGVDVRSVYNSIAVLGLMVYFFLDSHNFFVTVFSLLLVGISVVTLTSRPDCRKERWLMLPLSLSLLVGAFAVWLVERTCPHPGHIVSWGHVLWHFGTAAATYCAAFYLLVNQVALAHREAIQKGGQRVDTEKFKLLDVTNWPIEFRLVRPFFTHEVDDLSSLEYVRAHSEMSNWSSSKTTTTTATATSTDYHKQTANIRDKFTRG